MAGNYEGVFREDMFDEAKDHLTTRTCRPPSTRARRTGASTASMPWRAYRPAIVPGDSKTGEIDKMTGRTTSPAAAAHAFRCCCRGCQRLVSKGSRQHGARWTFVADATDHIAHSADKGLNKRAFHLTDPAPLRIGDSLNILRRAAHAPQMTMRINAALFGLSPQSV